ncbi:MAG: hypothetical protein Q9227_002125 [Pyrenula ochraceoflavens]
MVRLRLICQAIPESVFIGEEAPTSKPKQFLEVVPEPESVTIGWLVNKLRHRYQGMFNNRLPDVKYIKDIDDVDIDPEMSPFDAFINEGQARREGYDQRATIKLILDRGLRIREDSVVPDLTATKFRFDPPPPIPLFHQPTVPESDRPIQSLEGGNNGGVVQRRPRQRQEAAIIIPDSQADNQDVEDTEVRANITLNETEPKSESPELELGTSSFPPTTRTTQSPPQASPAQQAAPIATEPAQQNQEEVDPDVQTPNLSDRPSRDTILHRSGDAPRSPLRSISLGARQRLEGHNHELDRQNVPITPPSDGAQNARAKSKSSNGKLSRPACKISAPEASSTSAIAFPVQRRKRDVYDVPESDIEDSQAAHAYQSGKKRKLDSNNGGSSNGASKLGLPVNRSSPFVQGRVRSSEYHDLLNDRYTRTVDGPRVARDKRPVYDFTNPDTLPYEDEEEAEQNSEPTSAQDEVDQQLFNDSMNQTRISERAQKGTESDSDVDTESVTSSSSTTRSMPRGSDGKLAVSKSAPQVVIERLRAAREAGPPNSAILDDAISEKENIAPTGQYEMSMAHQNRPKSVNSLNKDYANLDEETQSTQDLEKDSTSNHQPSTVKSKKSITILNGINRSNERQSSPANHGKGSHTVEENGGSNDTSLQTTKLPSTTSLNLQPELRQEVVARETQVDISGPQHLPTNGDTQDSGAKKRKRQQHLATGTQNVQDPTSPQQAGSDHHAFADSHDAAQQRTPGRDEESESDSTDEPGQNNPMGLGITQSPIQRNTSSIVPGSSKGPKKASGTSSKKKSSSTAPIPMGQKSHAAAHKGQTTDARSSSNEAKARATGPTIATDSVSETRQRQPSAGRPTSTGAILPPGWSMEDYNKHLNKHATTPNPNSKAETGTKPGKRKSTSTRPEQKRQRVNTSEENQVARRSPSKADPQTEKQGGQQSKTSSEEAATDRVRTQSLQAASGASLGPIPGKNVKAQERSSANAPQKIQENSRVKERTPATSKVNGKSAPKPINQNANMDQNGSVRSPTGPLSSNIKPSQPQIGSVSKKPSANQPTPLPSQTERSTASSSSEQPSGLSALIKKRTQEEAAAKEAERQRLAQSRARATTTTTSGSEDDEEDEDTDSSDESSDDKDNEPSNDKTTASEKNKVSVPARVNGSQLARVKAQQPTISRQPATAVKPTLSKAATKNANASSSSEEDDDDSSADDTDVVKKDKTPPPSAAAKKAGVKNKKNPYGKGIFAEIQKVAGSLSGRR